MVNQLTSVNKNSINLILHSNISKDWQTINLSDQKAKWQKSENGIIQTKPVGSRKSASGSLLINIKNTIVINQSIHLKAILGSTHQIGLVFNYLDNNDFCLFLVDQHSKSYQGYHILIQEVRQGNCRTIAKENYAGRPNNASNFQIISEKNSLNFIFTELNIFQWKGRSLDAGLKAGLYSQGNNDSLYTSLIFIEKHKPKEEDIIPLPIDKSLDFIKNELNKYLKQKFELVEDKVQLSTILKQDGKLDPEMRENSISIMLINMEEEKAINLGINLNLSILIIVNNRHYSETLAFLTEIMEFFQSKNVFFKKNSPQFDIPGIEKLKLSFVSQTIEQQNHLWGMLGAKYMPSLLYKIQFFPVIT